MSTSDVRTAIKSVNEAFLAAFAAGDAARLAETYTENGQALPPNGEIATGRTAIEAIWQGAIDMGLAGGTLETIELEQHGDTAIEVGKYGLKAASGEVIDTGKYVVIWKQEQGAWRWHRDIWNSSRPAS